MQAGMAAAHQARHRAWSPRWLRIRGAAAMQAREASTRKERVVTALRKWGWPKKRR